MLLIYGKGKVGTAVAALCEYRDIPYEMRDDEDIPESYDGYDIIVPSPGVPSHHAIYSIGKVVSELDFAYEYMPKGFEIIAITGTDGKSTTSAIMYSILEKEYFGKKSVYLSGNFDIPFSATLLDILQKGEKKGIIVVEVSSFMAYSLERFIPDYSIFTNFKPDHLNWHKDLQDYLDSKMNLVKHTRKYAIINSQVGEFAQAHALEYRLPENARIFSQDGGKNSTNGEDICISGYKKYKLSETYFSGLHNAMNILSVTLVINSMKICSKRTRKYLRDIPGLPHRLQKIGEKNGIIFVEDSKSTSSQSLEAALGSYGNTRNLLLIVGGSDKGDSFHYLAQKFQDRVKAMVCIGATKNLFIEIARGEDIPHISTDSLERGVQWLYDQGSIGDILMLSPGCASFGLFRDYLDRALQFQNIIKKLPE